MIITPDFTQIEEFSILLASEHEYNRTQYSIAVMKNGALIVINEPAYAALKDVIAKIDADHLRLLEKFDLGEN
jgi:hypothetical protein